MTLENLLAIHRLQRFEVDAADIQRLIVAAARNLQDGRLNELSTENRFDAAYKAIMQCAMLGLWANGYRVSTNQPGHHQTAIQALPKSMGVAQDTVIVLDALRKRRNLSDYEGDSVSQAILDERLIQAESLLDHTRSWLRKAHPEWRV